MTMHFAVGSLFMFHAVSISIELLSDMYGGKF